MQDQKWTQLSIVSDKMSNAAFQLGPGDAIHKVYIEYIFYIMLCIYNKNIHRSCKMITSFTFKRSIFNKQTLIAILFILISITKMGLIEFFFLWSFIETRQEHFIFYVKKSNFISI